MRGRPALTVATILVLALGLAPWTEVGSQGAPVQARLAFTNRPAVAIPRFAPGVPIPVTLQIEAVSPGSFLTTRDFPDTDFFRSLRFTRFPGGIVINPAPTVHRTEAAFFCHSRGGVPQATAIPVVPVATVAGTSPGPRFFLEYSFPDVAAFYPDLRLGGHFRAQAVFSMVTFDPGSPSAVIADCDQVTGTLVNVGAGVGTSRQAFTVVSNTLEFAIGYTFIGFAAPVGDEAQCSSSPCLVANLGSTIPVKFELHDGNDQVVRTAVAFIAATQVSGTPPPLPPGDLGQGSKPTNQFRFAAGNQYVFNLDTGVLSRGVWRISANIDDGSSHSVLIRLR